MFCPFVHVTVIPTAQELDGFENSSSGGGESPHYPFVQLQLKPPVDSKQRQSSIKRQTRSPVFNEYFKWPVGYDELRSEKTLALQIYDFDKYSHNSLIGEVKVDFATTDVSTTVELWCDIEPATYVSFLVLLFSMLSQCSISTTCSNMYFFHVYRLQPSLTLTSCRCFQSDGDGCGDLLVSMSYLPTAERLTTIIMKARNLKQPKATSKLGQ